MPQDPNDGWRDLTLSDAVRAEAERYRVPVDLAFAMMAQESQGKQTARSPKGALGLFQLMPATAAELGVDPRDPYQNIQGGLRYFRQQLDAHHGDVELALAAYNAGPGAVREAGGVPNFPETQNYVQRIMAAWKPPSAAPSAGVRGPHIPGQPGPGEDRFRPTPPPTLPGTTTPDRRAADPTEVATYGIPERVVDAAAFVAEGFDPRRPEGRRNLAGAAGSAAAIAATGGTSLFLAPVLGAAAGGLIEEAGEQTATAARAGTRGTVDLDFGSMAGAALEQGAYEAIPGTLFAAGRGFGRRMISTRVGRFAAKHLGKTRTGITKRYDEAVIAAKEFLRDATARTGDIIARATRAGKAGIERARNIDLPALGPPPDARRAATEAFEQLQPPGGAVTPEQAGLAARETIAGPSGDVRDTLGQAVEEAARRGPVRSTAALRERAQGILEKEFSPAEIEFPRPSTVKAQEQAAEAAAEAMESVPGLTQLQADAATDPAKAAHLQTVLEAIGVAQEGAAQEKLAHPVYEVITRILNAGEEVSFEAAHLFKRQLDDALQGTADKVERDRLKNVTLGLRTELRRTLSGYAPYDKATAAYSKVVKLFTRGFNKKFRQVAMEEPAALVPMIVPGKPGQTRMLKQLLTLDEAAGLPAWNQVRAAWTNTKLLTGGIEKIGERLGKLSPEFVETMYGDAEGQLFLNNLRTIQSAYTQAVDRMVDAKLATQATRATARTAKAQAIRKARSAAATAEERARLRQTVLTDPVKADLRNAQLTKHRFSRDLTADEEAFAATKLITLAKTSGDQNLADLMRAGILGLRTYWGASSFARLLHAPPGAELLQWAAYSPRGTQLFVQLLESPIWPEAVVNALRGVNAAGASSLGPPPPTYDADQNELSLTMRGSIGTPPPAPPP